MVHMVNKTVFSSKVIVSRSVCHGREQLYLSSEASTPVNGGCLKEIRHEQWLVG